MKKLKLLKERVLRAMFFLLLISLFGNLFSISVYFFWSDSPAVKTLALLDSRTYSGKIANNQFAFPESFGSLFSDFRVSYAKKERKLITVVPEKTAFKYLTRYFEYLMRENIFHSTSCNFSHRIIQNIFLKDYGDPNKLAPGTSFLEVSFSNLVSENDLHVLKSSFEFTTKRFAQQMNGNYSLSDPLQISYLKFFPLLKAFKRRDIFGKPKNKLLAERKILFKIAPSIQFLRSISFKIFEDKFKFDELPRAGERLSGEVKNKITSFFRSRMFPYLVQSGESFPGRTTDSFSLTLPLPAILTNQQVNQNFTLDFENVIKFSGEKNDLLFVPINVFFKWTKKENGRKLELKKEKIKVFLELVK